MAEIIECPICHKQFEKDEDRILLVAEGEPNIYTGTECFVCQDCYDSYGDG
jgi:hypothetical protein